MSTKVSQELIEYLWNMITPEGGESLILMDLEDAKFDQYGDDYFYGALIYGTPTENQSKEILRTLRPGGHLMLIAPEEEPAGYSGACQIEDVGFEIRDSIFVADETTNFHYVPKASRSERGAGLAEGGNSHPTVKPVEIMRKLIEPIDKSETILDPFMGSGTTVVACIETGHDVIGIEQNAGYLGIADARVRYWDRQKIWGGAEIDSEHVSEEEESVPMSISDLFFSVSE